MQAPNLVVEEYGQIRDGRGGLPMRDPLSRDFSALQPNQDSWIQRVRENFRQLLTPAGIFPSSANGAPIHLLRLGGAQHSGRAQSLSLLTHATIIAVIAIVAIRSGRHIDAPFDSPTKVFQHLTFPRLSSPTAADNEPDPGSGSGGGRVQIPTTTGNFIPPSSLQLVRPSLPPKQNVEMPVPPTVFDPNAAPVLTVVNKIGLPWMKDDTNSPGPGASNTIGSSNGRTMGAGSRNGPGGEGESLGKYREGVTAPKCAYCPDPEYTDEAREAKLQGHVLLQVLVGADGRASQVRIVQGIGLGLDERAAQAIQTWKFVPAYDAGHKAVSSWVTVEAVFRLF